MATPNQTAANRRNAQESTGPRTPQGRAASRLNALKHGLTARHLVIRTESQRDFDDTLTRLPGPPPALRSHGNRSPPPARRRSLAPRSRPPGSDRDPRRPNLQTQRINRPHPRPSSSASRTAAQAPNRLLTPHPFPQNEPNSVPELTPRSPQPPRNSHATPEPTTHNPQPERPQAAPTPPVAQNEPNSVPPPPPEQTAGPPQPPFPPLHLHTHRDPGALGLL